MGQNKKERMWTLALKLARSGDYASWRQIEKELESQGFLAARRWLDLGEHDRLDRLCAEARVERTSKSKKHQTDQQQKEKALSRWENEGGAKAKRGTEPQRSLNLGLRSATSEAGRGQRSPTHRTAND